MPLSRASAQTVSAASTTSPSGRSSPGIVLGDSPAGNDSTLVAESLPRQVLFNARISRSSVSTSVTSRDSCRAGAAAKAARAAADRAVWLPAMRSQISARQTTSTASNAPVLLGPGSAMALTPLGRRLICVHDLADQFTAHDVAPGESDMGDVVYAGEDADRLEQARILAGREIDLRRVSGDNHLAALAESGEEHLDLHRRAVLRLIKNDHGVRQRAAAHEGERCDFNHASGEAALDPLRRQHVVQRVVERPQIGIDLLAHVAGKETEPLSGLDRRPRQDQAIALAALEE